MKLHALINPRTRIMQRGGGPGGRQYEYWEDDGVDFGLGGAAAAEATARTDREVEVALAACARYHQLIVQ